MAFLNGNKPIVTNGLVYALDFGNQKSYTSGSNFGRSLVFNPVTASVVSAGGLSLPNVVNGLMQFNLGSTNTTGSYVNISQNQNNIQWQNGSFTLQFTAQEKGGNLFITQAALGGSRFVSNLSNYGYYLESTGTYVSRGFSNPSYSALAHYTFRYSSGSYDFFVNGIPVSASTLNIYNAPTNGGVGISISGRTSQADLFWSGSIGNFYIYNKPLSSTEIWDNYQLSAQRYGLGPQRTKPYIDENAYLFLQAAGITDPIITSSINTFVLGLKSASLWDKMIAIYPFVGTGSTGVNLTGSHRWNLKEPSLVTYPLGFTGSWNGSVSGSTPSGSGTAINTTVTPSIYYPNLSTSSAHISILSYDTPVSSSALMGTGMTKDLAVSTLAGDYGTPAAAYSVRKVRTAYSGALMDVRRSYDNTTGSIGYVSNGDLDTGSLLDFVVAGRATLPGNYSGLAAAYSLRKVSGSYTGSAIDVRRDSDNYIFPIGFTGSGGLDTQTLLQTLTTGSNTYIYSNDFTQAVWYKYNVQITSSAIVGPLGLSSGSFLNETNASSFHVFDYLINPINTSSVHTISAFVKKQERRYVGLGFAYNGANGATTIFDLDTTSSVSTGSIGTGYSVISSSINYVTDGWFRISLTGTVGLADFAARFFLTTSPAPINIPYPNYTGEPGTGSYVYGFQYSSGSILQPYIETTGTARYNQPLTGSMGYVTKWYDQSGNNRHATQTATGSQPLIVSSGSLVTEGTKPAVKFYTNLGMDTGFTGLVTKSLFIAASTEAGLNINDNGRRLFSSYTGGGGVAAELVLDGQGTGSFRYIDGGATLSVLQSASYQLTTAIRNSTLNLAFNGGSITSGGSPNSSPNTLNYRIGEDAGLSSIETAKSIQEVILYNNDQSSNRTLIENNINNYYSIYTSSAAGYVARWYDQSGNNIHASQSVNGSQPLIVLSGSVISDNSRVGIYFDNTTFLQRGPLNVTQVGQHTVFTPYGDNTYNVWGPASGDAYWRFGTYNYIQLFSSGRRDGYPAIAMPTTTSSLFSSYHSGNNMTTFVNNVSAGTDTTQAFSAAGTVFIGRQLGTPGHSLSGSIKEIVVYNNADSSNRQSVEYGINNYYNLFPQTSSFTTSSFTIYATTSSISASINNDIQSGIASTGPLGFITVSRTGSNSLTIAKNGVTSSFTVPASGALSTGIYLGAVNNNGIAVGSSPYNISFASVGTGLTGTDIQTYYRLVDSLQINLQRQPPILYLYPSASTAFSVRKLNAQYSGPAFDIRRSSDNTTASIGFISTGDLDTTSLLNFVGTGTGTLEKWYDQSGNNNHLSYSSGNRHTLVVSGSLNTNNSKPCFISDTGTYTFVSSSIFATASASTTFMVLFPSGRNYLGHPLRSTLGGSTNHFTAFGAIQENIGFNSRTTVYTYPAESSISSGFFNTLYEIVANGSTSNYYINGSLAYTSAYGAGYTGSSYTHGQSYTGKIQEIITYKLDQTLNRPAIENNLRTYYSIY